MEQLKVSILYGCIGAVIGSFLFLIIKNKLAYALLGAVIFGVIFSIIGRNITKEDYNQYISESDEEKKCGKDVCQL